MIKAKVRKTKWGFKGYIEAWDIDTIGVTGSSKPFRVWSEVAGPTRVTRDDAMEDALNLKGWREQTVKMAIKVWDNGGASFDRYTIRIEDDYFGMSHNPTHPQGFNQYIGTYPDIKEDACGKEVAFETLPHDVRGAIATRRATY